MLCLPCNAASLTVSKTVAATSGCFSFLSNSGNIFKKKGEFQMNPDLMTNPLSTNGQSSSSNNNTSYPCFSRVKESDFDVCEGGTADSSTTNASASDKPNTKSMRSKLLLEDSPRTSSNEHVDWNTEFSNKQEEAHLSQYLHY